MKIFNCLLISFLLLISPLTLHINAQGIPVSEENYFLHTIEKGQSLYSIANMYNVTQEEIIRLNPGADEKIYAGNTIKIPQIKTARSTQFFHTIQPKETLYQLTKKYNVSAKEIVDANPGLSAENFKIGEVIVIPVSEVSASTQLISETPQQTEIIQEPQALDGQSRCRDMHKVKRKETIYSISREYGISERQLIEANPELRNGILKKGSFLCIPHRTSTLLTTQKPETSKPVEDRPINDRDLINQSKEAGEKVSRIKAGVILPFMLDGGNKDEAIRMLEYYEGFLIAVDSLKKHGVSIDLYTYDSGSAHTSIKPILAKKELSEMDMIFGPFHAEHISQTAEFAKEHNIHLIIPFSSKVNEVFNNPSVYQINTPQSYLYSEVYEHFFRKFPNVNIILVQASSEYRDKIDFIEGFKTELQNKNKFYRSVSTEATVAELKAVLDNSKENIFIPTSGTNAVLTKCLPQLSMLVKENPEYRINLFGYPEWQTYTKDHISSFYELDTYFYSSFYTNNLFPQAVDFTSNFWKWYGKDMLPSYPNYGMLGFDTGYFFLKGLWQFGTNFEEQINKINVNPIQTGFKFERASNWGGFINRKVFFIHFSKDFEVVKLNFD